MSQSTQPSNLRALLRANGIFSVTSGAVLVAGWSELDSALGVERWLLIAGGLALVGYGAALLFGANWASRRLGSLAVAMDLGWVVAAAVLLAGFPTAMTSTGRVCLAVVSVIVGAFAVLQARALVGRATTVEREA